MATAVTTMWGSLRLAPITCCIVSQLVAIYFLSWFTKYYVSLYAAKDSDEWERSNDDSCDEDDEEEGCDEEERVDNS